MKKKKESSFVEKLGSKIPDPAIIFVILYAIVIVASFIFGGHTFESMGADGGMVSSEIKNMLTSENVRWIFDHALLDNWLGYAGGILGTVLIVMFGIGIAEESGMLASLIKRMGSNVSDRFMPYLLVLLGILSNVATDAGYIVLIPLAGLLYVGMNKNPIIGMSAAFAGVSAGFSANIIPATVVDAIVGTNAKAFAESQGVPFVSYLGKDLNPLTMHYIFMLVSTVFLVFIGGFITNKFIRPRFENQAFTIPADINTKEFAVSDKEKRALKFGGLGFLISVIIAIGLAVGPLASFVDETGSKVNPFIDNIILIVTFIFFMSGLFYGFSIGKFKKANDIVVAMSKQLGSMGYIIVLTFFCYNFLALLSYSNIGTYITYVGANILQKIGLAESPILLLIGFIIITAIINLFVGGLSSKWMLLGPIFIPMLYSVNSGMTPDVVAAAYRVADSSTNIITPLMSYAGVILMYMRKYMPKFTVGNLISTMMPYSIAFIISWTTLLIFFIVTKIPLGF